MPPKRVVIAFGLFVLVLVLLFLGYFWFSFRSLYWLPWELVRANSESPSFSIEQRSSANSLMKLVQAGRYSSAQHLEVIVTNNIQYATYHVMDVGSGDKLKPVAGAMPVYQDARHVLQVLVYIDPTDPSYDLKGKNALFNYEVMAILTSLIASKSQAKFAQASNEDIGRNLDFFHVYTVPPFVLNLLRS